MLKNLVEMSNRYGSDENYVLAGGGNTSCKDATRLYIKGSGTQLATINENDFVEMDRLKLNEMLEKEYPNGDDEREAAALVDLMAARAPGSGEKRPSVETLLHNLFPYTYVLHVHPAMVNGLTCGKTGEQDARALFGEDFVWIPIYRPGYALSVFCRDKMLAFKQETGKDAQILLLQNHGVFVAADSMADIDNLMKRLMDGIGSKLKRQLQTEELPYDSAVVDGMKAAIQKEYAAKQEIDFVLNADVRQYVESEESFAPLSAPFTPDHIVYCKAKFLFTDSTENLHRDFQLFVDKYEYEPKVVCFKGVGAFTLSPTRKEADNANLLFRDAVKVAVYSESFGGALPMTEELVYFILHWEMESYRQKVAAK